MYRSLRQYIDRTAGFENHVLHRAIIRKHGDKCFDPGSRGRGSIGDLRPEMLQFLGAASRAVVCDQIVARPNQVAGHARPHIPKTDKSDSHDVAFLHQPSFSDGASSHKAILSPALQEKYQFDSTTSHWGCSGTNLQHDSSQNVPSLETNVRLGCLCQRIFCRNGDTDPSLGHGSFQACELSRTRLGVVSDHANFTGTTRFGLNAIGIRQTPASPYELKTLFKDFASRKGQNRIDTIRRKGTQFVESIVSTWIENSISTESPDQCGCIAAGSGRQNTGSESFCKLDGKRPHCPRCAKDQYRFSASHAQVVVNSLQRRQTWYQSRTSLQPVKESWDRRSIVSTGGHKLCIEAACIIDGIDAIAYAKPTHAASFFDDYSGPVSSRN
jgi:hypothetical protein